MTNTIVNLGAAIMVYQTLFDILDKAAQERFQHAQVERFERFKPFGNEIDARLEESVEEVEVAVLNFIQRLQDDIFIILNEIYPAEVNASE